MKTMIQYFRDPENSETWRRQTTIKLKKLSTERIHELKEDELQDMEASITVQELQGLPPKENPLNAYTGTKMLKHLPGLLEAHAKLADLARQYG